MPVFNVFVVEFKNDVPHGLSSHFAVQTNTIEGLETKMANLSDAEVSILMIDVLDQDNHPGNAQIDVGGRDFYADITPVDLF